MRRLRPLGLRLAGPLSAAALCLLLLAACEDPSGVGLTVLDPSENDPRARSIPADSAALAPFEDVTGAFLSAQGFSAFRGLAGRVDDPVYGTTISFAYLDVLAPSSFPDGFRDRPVEQAILRLNRGYVYGDTMATTRIDVRQVSEEWSAVGSPADTLFPVQDGVITTFDVAPGDSLIEVPLPADWIAANDTTLRSTQFSTIFHGFQLSPGDQASAVYGFTGGSSLQLISQGDTVRYGVSELFSGIEGPPTTPVSEDYLLLQDGTSRSLELRFDLAALTQSAINTVFLRVTADTAAVSMDLPAGFVRPFARQLALYGLVDGQDPVLITTATLNEERQTFSFASAVLTDIFQELVLGRSEVTGFALGFPLAPSSIDVIPLVRSSDTGCADDPAVTCRGPRATVFLIPSGG